jgi:hypothetical protein
MFLAILDSKDVSNALAEAGINKAQLAAAVEESRGSMQVGAAGKLGTLSTSVAARWLMFDGWGVVRPLWTKLSSYERVQLQHEHFPPRLSLTTPAPVRPPCCAGRLCHGRHPV